MISSQFSSDEAHAILAAMSFSEGGEGDEEQGAPDDSRSEECPEGVMKTELEEAEERSRAMEVGCCWLFASCVMGAKARCME